MLGLSAKNAKIYIKQVFFHLWAPAQHPKVEKHRFYGILGPGPEMGQASPASQANQPSQAGQPAQPGQQAGQPARPVPARPGQTPALTGWPGWLTWSHSQEGNLAWLARPAGVARLASTGRPSRQTSHKSNFFLSKVSIQLIKLHQHLFLHPYATALLCSQHLCMPATLRSKRPESSHLSSMFVSWRS